MILEVFSNFNDFVILWKKWSQDYVFKDVVDIPKSAAFILGY